MSPPSPSHLNHSPRPSDSLPSSSTTRSIKKARQKKVTMSSLAIKKRARSPSIATVPSVATVPPALIKENSFSMAISTTTTMSTSKCMAGSVVVSEPERSMKESLPGATSNSTFKFNELFSYYPPKLVVQDGDLCPQHSLSVNGLDRSKLNNLPQSHPFWNWTLGQPTKIPAAPVNKSCRKTRSKT